MPRIKWFILSVWFISISVCLPSFTLTIYGDSNNQQMEVHYIDVGQGDSIYIKTPEGKHILIDGGRPEYGKKVVQYLHDQKVDTLDLMVATHPDFDHIGGLVEVMKHLKVKEMVDSGKVYNTKTYARYLNEVQKQQTLFHLASKDMSINIDPELDIKVLNTHEKGKNNNQSSIVLKMKYKEKTFLFMGDLDRKHEEKLMEKYDMKADIIKVSHHGSKTSSSLGFLKKVDPQIALLTYKKRNKFGHPVDRVITNLNKLDAHIYSTAVYGSIIIKTNGVDYYIETEKDPSEGILEEAG